MQHLACRSDAARFPAIEATADESSEKQPEFEQTWATQTESPVWVRPAELVLDGCTGYERALMIAAQRVATNQVVHATPLDPAEVALELRALGSPHVWPRVWTLEARHLSPDVIEPAWRDWLESLPPAAERRCGLARAFGAAGAEVLAAVVVEPLADLNPLPAKVRSGQWLRFEARAAASVSGASLILLGPQGMPRSLQTSMSGGDVRAAFSLDQPGLWRAQLLVETPQGPRPALEAWVFADVAPTLESASLPAPGEIGVDADGELALVRRDLLGMVNRARASEQLPPLTPDVRLDELAQAHAEAMRAYGQAAHDTGEGSPVDRSRSAGFFAGRVGENVAQARGLDRAHRALWNSPSHRKNLLDPRFARVGLGIAVERPPRVPTRAHDTPHDTLHEAPPAAPAKALVRRVWVCQLFADSALVKTGDGVP